MLARAFHGHGVVAPSFLDGHHAIHLPTSNHLTPPHLFTPTHLLTSYQPLRDKMASPPRNSTQQEASTRRETDTDGSDIEDSGAGQTLVQILMRFVISILLGIVTVIGILSWIVTKPNLQDE